MPNMYMPINIAYCTWKYYVVNENNVKNIGLSVVHTFLKDTFVFQLL